MAETKKTKKAKIAKKAKKAVSDDPKVKIAEIEGSVDMFKTVATFGFLAAVMFCIGGPLVIAVSPGLGKCLGRTLVVLSGIAGFVVVVLVFCIYWKLLGPDSSSSPDTPGKH